MNILVIGNGFDIAHDLPTKYGQFLEFVESYKLYITNLPMNKFEKYRSFFSSLQNDERVIFDELNALLSGNSWFDYFETIYDHRKAQGKTDWIDFESEISTIVKTLDSVRDTLKEQFVQGNRRAKISGYQFETLKVLFYGKNTKLSSESIEFSNDMIPLRKKQLIDDLNRVTRCLEINLVYYVNCKSARKIPLIENIKPDYVLSFNYTDTYTEVYGDSVECDFIHGRARKGTTIEDNNMVLGIEEYLSDGAKDRDNEFIQFKKFYQRIYKMTGSLYKSWINNNAQINSRIGQSKPVNMNVHIYGHSLDPTDGEILKDLISPSWSKIYIYYYDKDSLSNQIANLVKVIGEEALIKLTDSVNGRIKFFPCK